MIIILEKISPETTIQDVRDFITPALKGSVFQKSGHIGYIRIETVSDSVGKKDEHYAIVLVNSDMAAQRIIKKNNMQVLAENRITVRQFFVRSWRNDPRHEGAQKSEEIACMREDDRRTAAVDNVKLQKIRFTR